MGDKRKRKRGCSADAEDLPCLPSNKKRQLFLEPAPSSDKGKSRSLLDDAIDIWLQQAETESEENDSVAELGGAVSGQGVVCMHGASSSIANMQM